MTFGGGVSAILVVGPAWVGDMVMAQSLFMALKRDHPDARLDVLAPPWTLSVLGFMPEVDGAIIQPARRGALQLRERYRLGRRLRAQRYEWAIVLPNSLKSALIPYWAGIPFRTGYVGEGRWWLLNDARRLDRRLLPRTVDRFVALAGPPKSLSTPVMETPALEVEPEHVRRSLSDLGVKRPRRPVLGLCPGAEYGPAKQWPADSYATIARNYARDGWAVWLFGSPADEEIGRAVADAAAGCLDLTGRTSLAQAIALMSLCSAVVSNDSGLMHVAAGLGKPLVGIFGSSSPKMTPPLSTKARVVSLSLPCSPCYRRECPLGHLKCLRELSPAMVHDALEELCESSSSRLRRSET